MKLFKKLFKKKIKLVAKDLIYIIKGDTDLLDCKYDNMINSNNIIVKSVSITKGYTSYDTPDTFVMVVLYNRIKS